MNIRMASFKDILAQLKPAQTMMSRYWNRLSQIFPNISPMLPDAYSARLEKPDGVDITFSISTPPGSGLLHAEVLVSSDDDKIAEKLQEEGCLDEVISFYGEESALETVEEVAKFIRSIIVIAGGAVDTDAAEAAKVSESEDQSEEESEEEKEPEKVSLFGHFSRYKEEHPSDDSEEEGDKKK